MKFFLYYFSFPKFGVQTMVLPFSRWVSPSPAVCQGVNFTKGCQKIRPGKRREKMHNLSNPAIFDYVNQVVYSGCPHRVAHLWTTFVDNSVDNVENWGFSTVIWVLTYPQPPVIRVNISVNKPLFPQPRCELRQPVHRRNFPEKSGQWFPFVISRPGWKGFPTTLM